MCATCGCGNDEVRVEGHPHAHPHSHDVVQIETALLAKNDALAGQNRAWLADRGIVAVNLMSSPGSGKTTLLARTITELAGTRAIGVVEGDQETRLRRRADPLRPAPASSRSTPAPGATSTPRCSPAA